MDDMVIFGEKMGRTACFCQVEKRELSGGEKKLCEGPAFGFP